MLTTLSEGSVRRNFNPYTDIDWDSPEFAVIDNDERWILPATDPLGRHPWYKAQPVERQIEIGMWRQANVAKVGLHFESILIRGLMNYAFWTPNGSPEYRYCLHEAVEECNHTMMFQEMVNRIGADVPGMPRLLKWVSAVDSAGRPGRCRSRSSVRHARRRGAHRPHAEERAARGQVAAPDHGAGDGHPRGRGGPAHLVRARVPAQADPAPAAAQAVLAVALRPADHADAVLRPSSFRRERSGRNSTSRARCARRCSSARRSPGRCCATCSATSGCCATTPV